MQKVSNGRCLIGDLDIAITQAVQVVGITCKSATCGIVASREFPGACFGFKCHLCNRQLALHSDDNLTSLAYTFRR